jgi:uncharacterized Zn finger protein
MTYERERKEIKVACSHCGCNTLLGGGTKNGVFVEKNYVGLLAEDRCAQCGHLFAEKHKIPKKMTLKLMMEYHKIETLFERDEKTHKVFPDKLRSPVYGIFKKWQSLKRRKSWKN